MTKFTFTKEELIYRQNVTDIEGIDLIYKGEYETFFLDTAENKHSIEIHRHPYCFGGISILLNRKKALKSVMVKREQPYTDCRVKTSLSSAMSMKIFSFLYKFIWTQNARRRFFAFCKIASAI